jgi:hypothetical protein
MPLTYQSCEATETYQGWPVTVTGTGGAFAVTTSHASSLYSLAGISSLEAAQKYAEDYIDSTTPDGCIPTAYAVSGTSSTLVRATDGTWSLLTDGTSVASGLATARVALAKLSTK